MWWRPWELFQKRLDASTLLEIVYRSTYTSDVDVRFLVILKVSRRRGVFRLLPTSPKT